MKLLRIGLLLILPAACGVAPDQGLVGSWNFDEMQGATAADASGSGNSGAILNGQWGAGVQGGALALDGSGDSVVTVALSDTLRSTAESITVAGRALRTARHNVALVAHGYPTLFLGFHGAQFKWEIKLANGRRGVCYADPKYRADLDRWYHVAATFNGWVARLYVDGQEICNDWTWGSIAMPDVPFTIGAYLEQDGKIIDEITGRIDDVRIYNRALTAREIQALAQGPNQ
jgi:hypothetical protein